MKFFKLNEKPLYDTLKADFFITLSLKDIIKEDTLKLLEEQFQEKYFLCEENESALSKLRKSYFLKYDKMLNSTQQNSILNQKGIADKVKDVLMEYNSSLYHMLAYTIMPNHIHLLIKLKNPEKNELQQHLEGIINLLKDQLNQNLQQFVELKDNLWTEFNCEYHLLEEQELINLTSYLVEDPAKTGLVSYWKDYPHTYVNPDFM